MAKQIEVVMQMIPKVKELVAGDKLCIVFRTGGNIELEKQLIEFRKKNVTIELTNENKPEDPKNKVNFSGSFKVDRVYNKAYAAGDKLFLELINQYEKADELELIKGRFDNMKLFMKTVDADLFEEEDEEGEFEEV